MSPSLRHSQKVGNIETLEGLRIMLNPGCTSWQKPALWRDRLFCSALVMGVGPYMGATSRCVSGVLYESTGGVS